MGIIYMIMQNTTKNTENTEKNGALVKVKVFGGDIVDRVVWSVESDIVYLCTQRCYDSLICGKSTNNPIGFPINDVIGL